MSRPARVKSIAIRLTKGEAALLKTTAEKHGVAEREWARAVLLRSLRQVQIETAIFTELMGLRLMVNGVLREIALGNHVTDKEFAAHLAEARKNKHQTAREVLAQYQPTTEGAQ